MKKQKPRPHNPDKLTKKQVGRAPWRLLDKDEIRDRKPLRGIELWKDGAWEHVWCGGDHYYTYRTFLTRAQLRRME